MTRDEFCLTLQHIRADSSGITAKTAAISEYDRLTAELTQARMERDEAVLVRFATHGDLAQAIKERDQARATIINKDIVLEAYRAQVQELQRNNVEFNELLNKATADRDSEARWAKHYHEQCVTLAAELAAIKTLSNADSGLKSYCETHERYMEWVSDHNHPEGGYWLCEICVEEEEAFYNSKKGDDYDGEDEEELP